VAPEARRDEACKAHVDGWAEQTDSIERYLAKQTANEPAPRKAV
jgi:hypothetical protein